MRRIKKEHQKKERKTSGIIPSLKCKALICPLGWCQKKCLVPLEVTTLEEVVTKGMQLHTLAMPRKMQLAETRSRGMVKC